MLKSINCTQHLTCLVEWTTLFWVCECMWYVF